MPARLRMLWPPALSAFGVAIALALAAGGEERGSDAVLIVVTVAGLVPTALGITRAMLRRQFGVDAVALLALIGALAYGEYLAGAVITVMLATGGALEAYAAAQAERELTALLQRAPRLAHRLLNGGLETISVDEVRAGDRLLVKEADSIPVDGVVASASSTLDESALTGESRLVERPAGDRLNSGAVNAGAPFEMVATATAEQSTFAGIVHLVRLAHESKAPFVRLADRYAAIFVPASLAIAGAAWAFSGDPVRALAVLVVATPCPLLLAAPIAIISGVSSAARRGIIVKGGGALEALARTESVLLDKTGTLTAGAPALRRVVTTSACPDEDELLRLTASLDQMSSHVLASSLVRAAHRRGLALSLPLGVVEVAGAGIEGMVEGRQVLAGKHEWLATRVEMVDDERIHRTVRRQSASAIFVAIDGKLAGALLLEDPIRPDAPRAIRALKALGVRDVVMVTGDHSSVGHAVGAALGVDHVLAEQTPQDKVDAVHAARAEGVTAMVGDGINDAPALAAADVGVAMGARGATSSSEAADVVITVDRLDRLVEAVRIARRARGIAMQSVLVGMSLSFVAMGLAAFGVFSPVVGALLQEGIDAIAILNALRALRGGDGVRPRAVLDDELALRLRTEHDFLIPALERLRNLADQLGDLDPRDAGAALREAHQFLADVVLPHERADDTEVYPRLAARLPGDDPLATMRRTHQEIFHLGRQFEALIEDLPESGPQPEDLTDLYRSLYALHAVLTLHCAQEEELYLAMHDAYLDLAPAASAR